MITREDILGMDDEEFASWWREDGSIEKIKAMGSGSTAFEEFMFWHKFHHTHGMKDEVKNGKDSV